MSNNVICQPLKGLIPLNNKSYNTRFWVPLNTPNPKSRFHTRDPIYRLCTIGNTLIISKNFLVNWDFQCSNYQ